MLARHPHVLHRCALGTATATYTVKYGYGTTLFLQPVNDTAHQTGTSTSIFKAGQTIPMKFQLKNAAGTVIQAGTAPKWLTPVKGSSTAAAVNESRRGAGAGRLHVVRLGQAAVDDVRRRRQQETLGRRAPRRPALPRPAAAAPPLLDSV